PDPAAAPAPGQPAPADAIRRRRPARPTTPAPLPPRAPRTAPRAARPSYGGGMSTSQVARAERLRARHVPGDPLVLVNVWDVLGARVVAAQGAPAVATASWAIAASLGLPDGEGMTLADNLAVVGRIAAAVDVPVTADLERGYGATPDDVATSVGRLLATGAVGCNLEDGLVELGLPAPEDPLRPV